MSDAGAIAGRKLARRTFSVRASDRAFIGVSALPFASSAALTVRSCASMSAMVAMPMVGGWRMSMVWMRVPGETWLGAAASFLAMWMAMTAAMMLPSLVPVLSRYRASVGRVRQAQRG